MRNAFRVGGKPISSAQVIKLSKIAIISAEIVLREIKFTGKRHSLIGYTRALKEHYGIHFVDGLTMDNVEDVMYSNFLAENFTATYILYIRVGKMMIKYQAVLSLFGNLRRDAPMERLSRTLMTNASAPVQRRTSSS